MSARLARLVLGFYPLAYRRRYGDEMEALLEDDGASPTTVLDLAKGAASAHLRPAPKVAEELDARDRVRLGASTVLLCWLFAAAAIFAFAKTIEGAGFAAADSAHPLLGNAHLALQLFAVLASAALLLGALPPVAIALTQLRRPAVRRPALAALACVAVAILATGAVVLVANSHPAPGTGVLTAVLAGWIALEFVCALGCALAARRGLFAAAVPDEALRLAGACAAIVAVAMSGIALALAAYLVGLLIDVPGLAAQANGPGGVLSVGASIGICVAVTAAVGIAGLLSALRTRRAILA